MTFKLFFLSLLISFLSFETAFAGGISITGGGEIIYNTQNPWWVKSKKVVKYCIAIDQKSFSASPKIIEKYIKKSFEFWKRQFSSDLSHIEGAQFIRELVIDDIGVATQRFDLTNCNEDIDLRFQFGFGTLNKEQRKHLKSHRNYIAQTVRTSYNKNKKLQGKGYIYFSSDRGPHAYKNLKGQFKDAWKKDEFLFLTLIHELGHVFGLPHIGKLNSIMAEGALEFFLYEEIGLKSSPTRIQALDKKDNFFSFATNFSYCGLFPVSLKGKGSGETFETHEGVQRKCDQSCQKYQSNQLDEVLRAIKFFRPTIETAQPSGQNEKCLHFKLNKKTKEISVHASTSANSEKRELGTIKGGKLRMDSTSNSAFSLINLMNIDQTVFKTDKLSFRLHGQNFSAELIEAEFHPVSGEKSKPVYIRFTGQPHQRIHILGANEEGLIAPLMIINYGIYNSGGNY